MKYIFLLLLFLNTPVFAQTDTSLEVEALYDDLEQKEESKKEREQEKSTQKRVDNRAYESLADLVELAPFEDVAVIQKRFMPKTKRFEFTAALGNSLNNAFFNNWGFVGKASWFLNENHGIEAMFYWLNKSERDVTESLRDDQFVSTTSLVVPENFFGVAYKWIPIYGKIALFNKTIIPFDLFFTAGGGMSKTGLNETESTIHLGMGQVYFWEKSWGLRWDLAMNMYQAKIIETVNNQAQEGTKNQTDLFLMIGASFYWPEATYR